MQLQRYYEWVRVARLSNGSCHRGAVGETRWHTMRPFRTAAYLGFAAASLEAFLQSDMNFLRFLPWTFLASASLEHSRDAAVRGASAFFSAGAAFAAGALFAAGAGVAGVVVCANALLINSRDAKAITTAREEIVMTRAPLLERAGNVARRC